MAERFVSRNEEIEKESHDATDDILKTTLRQLKFNRRIVRFEKTELLSEIRTRLNVLDGTPNRTGGQNDEFRTLITMASELEKEIANLRNETEMEVAIKALGW
jgi:hypothetical protein